MFMNDRIIKSAFESMLYTWGEPLPAKMAGDVFNIPQKEAEEYFRELAREYEEEGRGIRIREVDHAFQFVTASENFEHVQRLCTPVRTRRLSQSALEVLAIVAYRQPVTRAEIEAIRGIKCDRVLEGLSGRGLIAEVGRSAGIGRPILYGTTAAFLKNFGYRTLDDLPEIEDIEGVIRSNEEELNEQDAPADDTDAQQFTFDLTSGSGDAGNSEE